MRNSVLKMATIVLLLSAAGIAAAGTVNTTFQVSATVANSCSTTATDLAFGNYDPLALLPTDATSTVTVQCTLLTGYNIGLNEGTGNGATVAQRKMSKGGDTLGYSLYQDAARLIVWGKTTGTDTAIGVGTGLPLPHVVYGRIPTGQNVNTGVYNDVITVAVNF